MKIVITGATGLVGKELGKALFAKGHELIVISRSRLKAKLELPFPCEIIEWDLGKAPLPEKIQADAAFHLMGESIAAGRWSEKIKNEIMNSRVLSTRYLNQSLSDSLGFYLSASGIGIYGNRPGENLTEKSGPDKSFLSQVCQAWEAEADSYAAINAKARIAKVRIGLVLSEKGGALEKMLFPFKAGVGGTLGLGRHFTSWIHIQDLVSLMIFAFENQLSGPINGCSPDPVTNKEFSVLLAQSLGRSLGPPVPKLALRVLFGEMASILFDDQKAKPINALNSGFVFSYPNLNLAFENLLKNQKGTQELLISEQYFPIKRDILFAFFSEAKNLEKITPESLSFQISKMSSEVISEGMLIDYRLKVHGLPFKWKTKIEMWEPNSRFVDTQLKGPYSLWHHTHEFVDCGSGTLMRDTVKFRLPMGYLGWLGAYHLVQNDVQKIFAFRRQKVAELLWPDLKS